MYDRGNVKLILRISNLWPLFLALLILDTAWTTGWRYVARSSSPFLQALAGAALVQKN